MVRLVNLNQRLDKQDKAIREGSGNFVSQGITGPNKAGLGNPANPNLLVAKFLDNNPKQETFYQQFDDPAADAARAFLEERSKPFLYNTLPEGNKQFADEHVKKYDESFLIDDVDKINNSTVGSIFGENATDGNATMDSNVAGKFPSKDGTKI